MTVVVAAHTGLLADSGDGALGAGFIAFLVVLALCIGAFFLFRSMNRHLRNVPDSFAERPPAPGTLTDQPAAGTTATERATTSKRESGP